MFPQLRFFLLLLCLLNLPVVYGQAIFYGFEGLTDECNFTRNTGTCSWNGVGANVPWVNGFDVNRAQVDNAFAHSGQNSLRVSFPVNTFGPANSGAQAPLRLTPAPQYYASYWFMVSTNFSYGNTSEGGKLPGLAGGGNCSGCASCTGFNGFTARLMWRNSGRLVLYLYHLDKTNPPCGDNYTLRPNNTDFYITKGQWIKITERVKVNTGTNHDGEVELWVNDQPAFLKTGIQFVSNGDLVDNLYFSTFHGGSTSAWAPTVTGHIWFDDFRISTSSGDIFTPLTYQEESNQTQSNITHSQKPTAFPNPIQTPGILTLSGQTNALQPHSVQLLDLEGKKVFDSTLSTGKTAEIPLPALSKGLYFLRVENDQGIRIEKLMIE